MDSILRRERPAQQQLVLLANEAVEKVLGDLALPVGAPQSPRALQQVGNNVRGTA